MHDGGVGFDTDGARQRMGLGLISMEERLKIIGGRLGVDSHPGSGTTIHARVPLNGKEKSAALKWALPEIDVKERESLHH